MIYEFVLGKNVSILRYSVVEQFLERFLSEYLLVWMFVVRACMGTRAGLIQ